MSGAMRARPETAVPIAARCPQGKLGFSTRKQAKLWIKSKVLLGCRPYRCPERGCSLVHIGHLPEVVIRGEVGRDQMLPRSRPRPPSETYAGEVVRLG